MKKDTIDQFYDNVVALVDIDGPGIYKFHVSKPGRYYLRFGHRSEPQIVAAGRLPNLLKNTDKHVFDVKPNGTSDLLKVKLDQGEVFKLLGIK